MDGFSRGWELTLGRRRHFHGRQGNRPLAHGMREPKCDRRENDKKRIEQDLADRLFSYLYVRPALPAYNANSKYYQLNFFSFMENDSDIECDCDKAIQQSKCLLCKICFD